MPRRRSSAHWAAPIPAPVTTPPRTAADTESTRPATRWPIWPATGKARATSSQRHHGRNDRRAGCWSTGESVVVAVVVVAHDGSFRVVVGVGVGADPGDQDAVGMVDEVVAGEGVDTIGVAGDVGDGDRDDLAVARRLGDPGGPMRADRPERERTVRRRPMVVTSSLVWARSMISAMAASSPTASWWITFVGFGGHGCSVGGTPDTALSRRPRAYPAVVIAVSVLDVVELHRDGERIAVRPGKTTEVLVRLALEAGVMVRTERLIEDLWADEAVGTARNMLQTKVSRLRRALGDAALVTGTSCRLHAGGRPERGRCARGAPPGRAGLSVSKRRRPVRCAGDVHDGAGDVPGRDPLRRR